MAVFEGSILNPANKNRRVVLAAAMKKVKDETGKGAFSQAWEIWRLGRAPGKMTQNEYYLHELFRDSLTWAQKLEYGTTGGFGRLNRTINGPADKLQTQLISDKLLCSAVLDQAGCPTPKIIAIATRRGLPSAYHSIRTTEKLREFLASVDLPIFGKPMGGSGGRGVMSLFERSGDGATGVMGDGREVRLEALATEILQTYPEGYLFQPFIENHADIAEFNPRAAQAVRFVTIKGSGQPELLYVTWRFPGMTALSDNNSTAGKQVTAGVDLATGTALRARSADIFEDIDGREDHPESGLKITGRKLPHFQASCDLVREMHLMFPEHAILGWDVVQSPKGPVMLECNSNPLHFGYQLAFQRGFMNPDMMMKLKPLIARNSPGFVERLRRLGEQQRQRGAA
jgi:hypothetical protein